MFDAFVWLCIITIGYITLCARVPFGRCRRCKGFGFIIRRTRSGHLRRGRDCRRCNATGVRLRIGRRIWNAWDRARQDSAR
jgi:hypothetical protein